MRKWITTAVIGGAFVLSSLSLAAQAPADSRDLVVASGDAVVKRAADQAFVVVTAETRAKVPAEAQKTAAVAMTSVQQRLTAGGIGSDAIRTMQYDLQPEFDYANGRQTLRGYVARNSIEVRLDAIARTGEVIDLVVQSGATSVSSVRFDLKERQAIEREALTKAVEAARGRAEAAAKGAGRTLDRIVRIEDQGATAAPPPRPYMMAMRAEAAAPPPTPIQAGEVEIRAQVMVTVQLK